MTALRLWLLPPLLLLAGITSAHGIDLPDRRDPREPTLTDAINAAIIGKRPPDEFTITARWAGLPTITVWGEGLGVLDTKNHFLIEQEQFISLLKMLRKANFVNLPDRFGKTPQQGQPQKTIGQLTLLVGDRMPLKHMVTQFQGEVNEDLEKLIREIIQSVQQAAANTITPANVEEGLKLLADETIPQRAFRLMLRTSPIGDEDGIILDLQGRKLTSRNHNKMGRYSNQLHRTLSESEWTALLTMLRETKAATLPTQLPYEHYTSFHVSVLGKLQAVQAKAPTKGSTPIKPSAERDRFLTVLEHLKSLHAVGLKENTNDE